MTSKFIKVSPGLVGLGLFLLLFHLASAATLDLTNAQKLSLPTSTSIGQKVRVSDGFVVSGEPVTDGFFYQVSIRDGKPAYFMAGDPNASFDDAYSNVNWDNDIVGGTWSINGNDGGTYYISHEDVAYPWLVTTWTDNSGDPVSQPTLTHPAIQQLTVPSTDETAVFISNAGTTEANGIWTERGVFDGKPYYNLLGSGSAPSNFYWDSDSGFWFLNPSGGDPSYSSADDVMYPWLITTWQLENGSNLLPTASSVNQGELDAGVTVAGAGDTIFNGVYSLNGNTNGHNKYSKINGGTDDLIAGFDFGYSFDPSHAYFRVCGHESFPWINGDEPNCWDYDGGTPPGPDITRNDVASEANWEVTTDDEPETPSGGGHHRSSSGSGTTVTNPTPPTTCNPGDLFSATTGKPCTPNQSSQPSTPIIPTCTITSTLALGWVGPQVKCLQTILNISTDGIFGPKTKAAVILFQKAHGLVPDGIVGPKTRAELFK